MKARVQFRLEDLDSKKIAKMQNLRLNYVFFQKKSWSKNLSEEFIRQFQDKLDWRAISYSQNLSENFIQEFKDRVYWEEISYNGGFSEEFLQEFCQKFPEKPHPG